MARRSPLVREAIVALAERGLAADVAIDGKHFKIHWLQGGRKHLLVISRSASDRRAAVNSRTMLRRLLTAGGAAS
jgi:hypothetical protein